MSTFSFHSPYVASKIRGNMGSYGTSIAMGSKTRKYEQVERDFLVAYDENADALFRHCFARVRDRELAKDITQETFVRTWEYLAKGKQIEHPRAFLYRTLNNCLVDTMRKKRSASLDAMAEETGFEPEGAPDLSVETREEMGEVAQLITHLDEAHAAVITMRFIDEMKIGEIANVLAVSENVVSVRLHRAMQRLRELWKAREAQMKI